MDNLLSALGNLWAVLDRLKEAGTWRLIIAVAAMFGVNQVDETMIESGLTLLALLLVIWEMFQKDASTLRKEMTDSS